MTPVTMQKKFFFKVIFLKMASRSYNAVQVLDLLDADSSDSGSRERRETTSRAIGGPVSGLVDQTPSTLILKMGVKKMIEVSLSFSCLSLEK